MESGLGRTRTMILLASALMLLMVLRTLAGLVTSPFHMLMRAAALLGYLTLFLAIMSYQYRRQMLKMFGRPFLKVHHILSVGGLALVVLHPFAYAARMGSLSVFVPVLSPLSEVIRFAGQPALFLFLVATAAGVVRNRIKARWKLIHYLSYVAFLMAFVHGSLLGTDLGAGVLRWLYAIMALLVVLALIERRWTERSSARSKAAR